MPTFPEKIAAGQMRINHGKDPPRESPQPLCQLDHTARCVKLASDPRLPDFGTALS
jgi:hypothetical protein